MIKIRPLTRTTGLTFGGRPVCFFEGSPVPPTPTLPPDMDFVYLAKNFDGTKVVNAAPNSTFGDYLAYGTITSNGSGASCYLSNNVSASNYLYKTLTNTELDNIKASSGTYTFFIRMMQTSAYSGSCGGIMSTRSGGGYIYMIRCENMQLQFHSSSAYNLGSDFMMNVDRVYKITVRGSSVEAKNLDTDVTWTGYVSNRSMGNTMTTFWAGYSDEAKLDRFYGFAGIPSVTTAAEDEAIKDCLMNQSV